MKSVRVGDAIPRLEDERLLRGQATFFDDLEFGPRALHATFVRSAHAHARVHAIDTTDATALEGVRAVFTAADFLQVIRPMVADFSVPGFQVTARPVLAVDCVRFVGDTLAMVLADDPYVALDAADLVAAQLEPLPAVADAESALAPGAPLVHETAAGNVFYEGRFESDGFAGAHGGAPLCLRERFASARQAAVPMEPRGCAAVFDRGAGELTVWSSTQVPHMVQTCIAEHLGLAESRVRVIVPETGGGFGMKAAVYPEELLVAAAAIRLGVPVKWVQDRYDDFLTGVQARGHVYEVEAGYTADGVLVSVDVDLIVNAGAYATLPFGSSLEANGAPRNLPGPYRLRHFRYRTRAVATHTTPTGAYRGVAGPLAFWVMEGLLDRIAASLAIDPAEVRRRNLVEQFPYTNVLGLAYSEGCFLPAFERALALVGYDELRAKQRATAGSRVRHGIGMAVITEQTGMGSARYKARGLYRVPGYESASVRLEPDGSVTACVSQTAQGQGHETAFAQVISEVLGAPLESIRVVEGDTARTPFGTGTFASRGMVLAGNALAGAAGKVREKLVRIASRALECAPGDLLFADGGVSVVGVPAMRLTLRELASRAYSVGQQPVLQEESHGLYATEYYDTPMALIASAAHVAAVALDTRTGQVRVERYAIVHDCGRMINPALVDGQVQGGTVQGLGEVLMEAATFDPQGQPLATSLLDYQLPRCADVPREMVIEPMHSPEGETTFKGVGESGTMAAVPAIAGAIADALGRSVNELPLTATRILDLLP